jgi:hypothetical protein
VKLVFPVPLPASANFTVGFEIVIWGTASRTFQWEKVFPKLASVAFWEKVIRIKMFTFVGHYQKRIVSFQSTESTSEQ